MNKPNRRKRFERRKANMDDGFNAELVRGASFDGSIEIPSLKPPNSIVQLSGCVPFSMRDRIKPESELLHFCEWDFKFTEFLKEPEQFYDELREFALVATLDCSLYRDAPLTVQILNLYRSRAFGFACQQQGINVCPLIRWADERTYTDLVFPEPPSFLGIEKNSPVIVSPYGCVSTKEDMRQFRAGLIAMINYLDPSLIFVHGPMPNYVFEDLLDIACFVHFPDWTTRMKGGE